MKKSYKILYCFRLVLFIISMIFIFLTIKNYMRIGIWGYLFFIVESLYVIVILITMISKKDIYMKDSLYNSMHIGTYIYQIIISHRTISFPASSLLNGSFIFYQNNYIIIISLLIILIIYSFFIKDDKVIKKSR